MANAKNQVFESKAVNKTHHRLHRDKKRGWQNEGITRHIYENK
jgi:hypothetical protein